MSDFARPTEFLAIARERRRVMMRSTCRITRPSRERVFDPATGEYDTPDHTVVYEGPCHLISRVTNAIAQSYHDFGGGEVANETAAIALPWDAPMVDNSDSFEMLASDDQWIVDRGPRPVGWVRYADSRTMRILFILVQDRPGVNDA